MHHTSFYSFYWIFWLVIAIEAMIISWRGRRYAWRESLATLGVAIGHFITVSLFKFISIQALLLAWHYRVTTLPLNTVGGIMLLFLGIEFFYYWFHRASHRVRWFWATHAVHHSAAQFNLSAAYRLGWTGALSGSMVFFMPLSWLGFAPMAVGTGLSLNLIYQFWLHTELIPKLGPLEWILNTPAHHRIHHASNPVYLDCNYGGVLIVFDRLFGTFRAEQPAVLPVYGLTKPLQTDNPFVIALGHWYKLLKDLWTARTWSQRWCYAFYPPGWKPNIKQTFVGYLKH